jgi:hypothetical protein
MFYSHISYNILWRTTESSPLYAVNSELYLTLRRFKSFALTYKDGTKALQMYVLCFRIGFIVTQKINLYSNRHIHSKKRNIISLPPPPKLLKVATGVNKPFEESAYLTRIHLGAWYFSCWNNSFCICTRYNVSFDSHADWRACFNFNFIFLHISTITIVNTKEVS